MPSFPLGNINGRNTSGVTCYHLPSKEYTIGRCRALHVIIAHGHHTRSEDVRRGMPACPFGSSHGLMTSGVGCHHRLWTTYMVARDHACYAIITIRKHTRSDDVGRDMPCLPLDSTHRGMTSAWYVIIAVGQHIRLKNVRRDMPSWPFSKRHSRTTSGMKGNHRP